MTEKVELPPYWNNLTTTELNQLENLLHRVGMYGSNVVTHMMTVAGLSVTIQTEYKKRLDFKLSCDLCKLTNLETSKDVEVVEGFSILARAILKLKEERKVN